MWPMSLATSPFLVVFPTARDLLRAESSKRMGLFVHQYVPTQCNQLQEVAKARGNATPVTTKPYSSVPWEEQPCPATETTLTRSLRQLNGRARHTIDLRAWKSFEHDGCSEWVFSASLASPVMGSVESRRMHQMHLVKLGVNKGGRFWDPPGICVSGIPNLAT